MDVSLQINSCFLLIFQVDTYFDFLKCSLGYLSGVMSRNMLYVVIIVDYQAINVVFIKAFKIVTKVAIGLVNFWQQCRDVWAQIKAQAVGGSHFFDINKRLDQQFQK